MDSKLENSSKRLEDQVDVENVLLSENPHCKLPRNYFDTKPMGKIPSLSLTPWERSFMPIFPATRSRDVLPHS